MSLLSEGNQRRLLEGSTRDAYAPGTVIFHPASEGRAYLLERGLARGYTSVPDGRQATITFFHSRELIGGTSSSPSPLQGERVGEQSVSAILIAALRAGRRKNVL